MRKSDHNYAAARTLRKAPSLPEGLLWRELRTQRSGLKFRRQHPVGRYVLDFYCAAAKCGIEIDGIAHDMGSRPQYDSERDAWLGVKGIRVMRFAAQDVLGDPADVATRIVRLCAGIIAGEV
jgi:very-short-patch-repair endonuclease